MGRSTPATAAAEFEIVYRRPGRSRRSRSPPGGAEAEWQEFLDGLYSWKWGSQVGPQRPLTRRRDRRVIDYDRTNWWQTCFAWRGTVLPHVLGARRPADGVLPAAVPARRARAEAAAAASCTALDPLGHTVLGVALSMLIVFRTNSSQQPLLGGAVALGHDRQHQPQPRPHGRRLRRRRPTSWPGCVAAYVLLVKEQLRDNRDLGDRPPPGARPGAGAAGRGRTTRRRCWPAT